MNESQREDAVREPQHGGAVNGGAAGDRGAGRALAGCLLALAVFWLWGILRLDGFELGLGSHTLPTPRHARVLVLWMVTGSCAAGFLAAALQRRGAGARPLAAALSDRRFVLYAALLAGLVPALLRQWVLLDTPTTDDESAYRLAAQLLASGRLYMPSPPEKEFFDNLFLVNDGKLFTQYFLGWPALMVPGVRLGLEDWMNALYSALTVPPLFWLVRRYASSAAARLVTLCYLTSPMLMVGAGTALSHTSCLALLTWLFWVVVRAADPDGATAPRWAAAAVLFSAAFFVRPLTALGIGLPLLLALAGGWWRARGRRLRLGLAFAAPSFLFAVAFLAVNQAQSGHPLKPAYVRTVEYARENGLRFSAWDGHPEAVPQGPPDLQLTDPRQRLRVQASALVRLNSSLYGWPFSLLLAALAWRRGARLPWSVLGSFFLLNLPLKYSGIDLFGPVHYFEAALPLLVLTGVGADRLDALRLAGAGWRRKLPASGALVLACVLTALCGYTAVRLGAVREIAAATRTPWRLVEQAGIGRAVVFVKRPFVSYRCLTFPSRGWVNARPNNDPELENEVLWVNDLGLERDRAFLARFPDRTGFVSLWLRECRQVVLPLDLLEEPAAAPEPEGGGRRPR